MPGINDRIAPEAAAAMRTAIADAHGREVFFIGHANDHGCVVAVAVAARGSDSTVAALTHRASYGDVAIHNHSSGPLEPSDADVTLSSIAAWSGIASFIVNNDVSDVYVLVEPMLPPKHEPLDADTLATLLGHDSPLGHALGAFEERPAQKTMLAEVVDAFNHDKLSIIEAGTGTGKTLAYLIPAVAWALKNGERVAVSTHTINLQEQIMHKDLPLVRAALGVEFKAVLVKGRGNYACRRRAHMIEDEPELFEDEDSAELHQLLDWAFTSSTGDLADLGFFPKARVWEKIESSGDTCFKAHCPFFRECFVLRARREAASAHLLVTNHSLLFADLAVRAEAGALADTSVLPKYQRLILDEAHNIEETATDHFTSQVSRGLYLRVLNLLHRRGKRSETGSLSFLRAHLLRAAQKLGPAFDADALLDQIEQHVSVGAPVLLFAANDCFEAVARLLAAQNPDDSGTIQWRLTTERRAGADWAALSSRLLDLKSATAKFTTDALETTKQIAKLPLEDDRLASALMEVNAHLDRLVHATEVLDAICNDPSEEFVCWLDARISDTYIHASANRAPLDVASAMIRNVFEQFPTVVMTSATLTSRKKFDFFSKRVGLTLYKTKLAGSAEAKGVARPIAELLLPTPFDFTAQALMAIPTDLDTSFIRNRAKAAPEGHTLRDAILRLLAITKGSAFVLFTSYGLLKKLARELADELEAQRMTVLVQGTEHRDELLRRFRKAKHAVLFGTDSFWAGVDVVGEALQSVIITKLPFRVPTEPVIEARTEYIEAHGGNAFTEYTVPLAVIKFRQGFGRLIRSTTDYGMVAILDRRVIDMYYGKWFLESLPACIQAVGSLDEVTTAATAFFAARKKPRKH